MGETRREDLLRELDARLAATDVALAERGEPVDLDAPRGTLLSRDQGTGKPNR